MERASKHRAAGFRTYMLVCLGAALASLLGQYEHHLLERALITVLDSSAVKTDVCRFGAQVINGIGFLGAGTIMVTSKKEVKGVTTAAGLWACACVGLAIGIGFYAGAIIGCALILLVMSVLHRIDDRMTANTRVLDMYMEFQKMSDLGVFMSAIKEHGMKISDIEMTKSNSTEDIGVAVLLTLKLEKKRPHTEIIELLSQMEGVRYIEEL